jgi:hypothetical protein
MIKLTRFFLSLGCSSKPNFELGTLHRHLRWKQLSGDRSITPTCSRSTAYTSGRTGSALSRHGWKMGTSVTTWRALLNQIEVYWCVDRRLFWPRSRLLHSCLTSPEASNTCTPRGWLTPILKEFEYSYSPTSYLTDGLLRRTFSSRARFEHASRISACQDQATTHSVHP